MDYSTRHIPVILAAWETEIGRIVVPEKLRQKKENVGGT
jgi:hypothetical protein